MASDGRALYLGTDDFSWSVPGDPAAAGEAGFDLYATCDGRSWSTVTRTGFGDGNDFGARTLTATPAGTFLGTTNHVEGTTVQRLGRSGCRVHPSGWGTLRQRQANIHRRARGSACGRDAINALGRYCRRSLGS